jgi:mono/diheme cytochrome c family protein
MARRIVLGVVIVIALFAVGFVAWAWRPEIAPVDSASKFDQALVARGAQLAALGNCVECHTAAGGKGYAGGYPLDTPFGTIYGTNITPDRETGIGQWSLAAFTRAMREGIRRDGAHLYPAFPYNHFTRLTDDDIQALYGFLMTREPVRVQPPKNDLAFPLNIRMSVAFWNALYLEPGPFQPDSAQPAQWNRGAYLVQGLGHCGACHTPRNALGAEQPARFLSGGQVEGWIAWTRETLERYLSSGIADAHAIAAGPMVAVVNDLATARPEDVKAIATYIASVMGTAGPERRSASERSLARARVDETSVLPVAARKSPPAVQDNDMLRQGLAIYSGTCAQCHDSGRRTASSGDALHLALSTALMLPEPTNLVRVILQGLAPIDGEHGPIMPAYAGALTDAQIASLIAYLRADFTNQPAWKNVEREVRKVRQNVPDSIQ